MKCKNAIHDLKTGFSQYRVWLYLGWSEVKQRYRRSIIGPWWISLSMLIFISAMGIVFSRLFHQKLDEYLVFFSSGFLFWSFISNSITESAEIFKSNESYIKQVKLPYSVYVLKHIVKHAMYFFHNFFVYFLVCLFFKFNPGWCFFVVIPGVLLLALNLYWICFLAALISTRFRDMVPIVTSCMQIAFFVTPVSWMPGLLNQHSSILKYNPFFYLLDVVRSPLLGVVPQGFSWCAGLSMLFIGCAFSLIMFSKFRSSIVFWIS